MAARKFKFVSPGIFLREVDNSQLPKLPGPIGPVIIGRTRKGPAMKPITVNSYADFVEVFGDPVPGGQGDDVWREGNGLLAPAYAHYAAKAYFAADIDSPVTTIRLAGVQGDNATDAGAAGWTTNSAWGLFVLQSGSTQAAFSASVLAAVIYGESPFTASLSNAQLGSSSAGSALLNTVCSADSANNFTIHLKNSSTTKEVNVSFDRTSKDYIRKALNTNPVATNGDVANTSAASVADKYWLGETFEEAVPSGNLYGFITRLRKDSTINFADYSHEASVAQTGWVFSQNDGTAATYDPTKMTKLFRVKALHEGEAASKEYTVSIEDIRIPEEGDADPYGTFSVVVRKIRAGKLEVVESFTGCNLNPNSSNYVARQVGDQFTTWSAREKRNKIYGNYPNRSRVIRMDMKSDVDNGLINPSKVPFGFLGPIKPADNHVKITANKNHGNVLAAQAPFSGTFLGADTSLKIVGAQISTQRRDAAAGFTVTWPSLPSVISASVDGTDHFGAAVYKVSSTGELGSVIDPGYMDYIRKAPEGLTTRQDAGTSGSLGQHAFIFSFDDVFIGGSNLADISTANVTASFYLSGSSRRSNTTVAYTATGSAATLLQLGFDKFQMPLVGGCDGVNITEADPFNNRVLEGKTTANSYAFASVDRAIELIKDPELIEHNLALLPGITNTSLTTKLIEKCEARADSLAIIDLPGIYKPPHELKCESFSDRLTTNPNATATALKQRQINSSYGAAYYPWVKVRDVEMSRDVWVPPSVIALGVMAYTEESEEVWFAPAGFNRGGLNEGNAGLPVLQVSEQLLSKQRDTLYAANINPIASFVTEGIVVFGQKTLQSTQSALDRINVRRLLIFVKKEISRIASGLLFDQNVPATWNRFLGQVNPFLQSVQTRLGLSDFKVILDNTTTTPDLVDRNVMYAKIFLKPARAIEFIAVDFVITNTGASFED